MVLEFLRIMLKSIAAIIPCNARYVLKELLEVLERDVEHLGVAFGTPEGSGPSRVVKLCTNHICGWFGVGFE